MKRTIAAVCLLALMAAGCTTSPAEYAAGMPAQDPKWISPECVQMRADAATYASREKRAPWAAGVLLGPYGLGLVAAAKEGQARKRKQFVRDMHLACSSRPLPPELLSSS